MSTELTDNDLDRLATRVADRLADGQQIGNKLVLDRRRLMHLVASGTIGVGALAALSKPAAAQAVGQIGDSTDRVDLYGETVDTLQIDLDGDTLAQAVVDSGSVDLTDGEATTSTGITASGATFYPAIGVDDPGADVTGLSAQLDFDNSSGEYELTIKETDSSQDPTVNYDIVRVR